MNIKYAYRTREQFNVKTDFRYSVVLKGEQKFLLTEYNIAGTGWKHSSMTEIIDEFDREAVNSLFMEKVFQS